MHERIISAIAAGRVAAVKRDEYGDALGAVRAAGYRCHGVSVGNAVPRFEVRPGDQPERGPEPVPDNPGEPQAPTYPGGLG